MKIMHEQVDFPGLSPVKVKWRKMPHFTYPWHFHNEYELLYVIDGFGTSYVADSIRPFKSGDMVLLGSNLPHYWKSDNLYHSEANNSIVNYIVVQVPNNFFHTAINNYPEFHQIKELLERSSRGICFLSPFKEEVAAKIKSLARKDSFDRIILLLDLLQMMAKTTNYKLLAGELYHQQDHDFNNDRLTRIMNYLNMNYREKIKLDDLAGFSNMHPSAFCRFFKEKTGKTLKEFVNDMRISYACRLVLEGNLSISQICYESGYVNISNFNRCFKKQTGYTPSQFFMEYHKK